MTESNTISPTTPTPPKKRKWLRRTAWTLLTLLLIIGIVATVLQTDWAANKIRGIAEDEVSSVLHGGHLTIGSLEGNLLYGLVAKDVRVFSGDSLVVSVDSVRAEYNFLSLLFGNFRFSDLDLVRPVVIARQLPDSTWDLLNLAPPDTSTIEDLDVTDFRFDRVRIVQGKGAARFHALPDSTIHVQDLDATLRDLYFGGGRLGSTLDEARMMIVAPIAPDPVSIVMHGELGEDRIICTPCRIESTRSDVSVSGHLLFPEGSVFRGDLRLNFDPLVLGDVAFALPSVDPEESVVGNAIVTGSADSASARVEMDFSSGATANFSALIQTGDFARVRVDGDINGLNPAVFQRDLDLVGTINSEIDVDLAGSALSTLTGPVSVRIFDTVLNGVELRDGYLNGRFEDGTGRLESRLFLPGVALDARGTVAPFADTLEYDLTGSFRAQRLRSFYPGLPDLDAVEGKFELAGRGTTPETATARTVLALTRLVGPQVQLGQSRLEARLDRGEVALSAQIAVLTKDALDAGSIQFDATMKQAGGQWHAETENLRISDLDLQAITAEAPAGLLSATGRLSGDLAADSLLRAAGSLSISGDLGPVAFSETKITADFEAGDGTFDIDIQSNIGSGQARGDFRSVEEGYQIATRGRVSSVNIDTLLTARLVTNLNGSVNVQSLVSMDGLVSLSIDTRLGGSVVNEQPLDGALITASLADSSLSFDVDIELPNGSISGEGSFKPFDEEVVLQLREASFAHVNLAAWLDETSLETDLNGKGSADIDGANISGVVQFSPSRINRVPIGDGGVQVAISDSTLDLQTTVDVDRGNLAASLTAQFGRTDTTYQGMIRLRDVDVAGLMGVDTLESNLNAGCSFVGSNFSRPRLEASALCTARSSTIGAARIDSLRFETTLDKITLTLDSLFIQSNVARVAGSGSIPVSALEAGSSSEINIEIEVGDLAPAAEFVGATDMDGVGVVTLMIGGSVESPSFSAEAALEYLAYDEYRVSSLDGFFVMTDVEAGHIVGAVDAGFSVFNDVPIQRTSLEIEKSGNVFLLTGEAQIDNRRNARVSARYEEEGEIDLVVVDALDMNLDGEIWTLSEEALFEISDQWSVRTFLLFSETQQIAFDGHIDPDGEQNLIVTLDQVRFGAFTDLIGYPGVEGTGEGYIVLTGAHDDLQLESNVRVQSLKTYDREVGNFDLSATYASTQMDLNGRLSHSTGSTLTFDGFVPMRLTMTGLKELDGTEPVELAVKSDSIPLAWIRPFLDQTVIDRIEGYLISDVQIGGTWGDPSLSGNASVNGGRVRLPTFKLDMRSVSGTFRLDGNQLLVDKLTATSEGGKLNADGSVGFRSLDDPTFDLDAKFDNFRAISTETYQVTVTGSGRLTGSMINPVFSGNMRMEESDIFMTEELMADEIDLVRLTERDLRILERRFGYRVASEDTTQWDFYEALDLSIDITIGRDVWFRSFANPKMDIEFSGDLTVSKKPLRDQIVSGAISVNPSRSRVVSFARRFQITTGEIQFNGLVDEALVDIHAEYAVPSRFGGDEVKIKLQITGTFGDMRLNLTSEPQMDTGAMVSYLTTGRPPGEASVGGTQAAELAVSSLSNLVEGFANTELGLDLVEIQVNPTRGTSLTVGKYVSPRVYVSLTQPLVTNDSYQRGDSAHQTAMAIEYELITWLVAQLASSRNQLQVNLIWEYSF